MSKEIYKKDYLASQKEYTSQTTCSVKGCKNPVDFEVILYDEYEDGKVFYEQDSTCPFLCRFHQGENERLAKREEVVYYPYTNQGDAKGYTKYIPIREAYPQCFTDG